MKRFVVSALVAACACGAACEAQTPNARDSAAAAPLPRYRYRILGVYDEQTGDPIEDVDVVDVLSGNIVRTTSTGTASLRFLPDGGGLVRVRKLGYALTTIMVGISPKDTTPVTMVLHRAQELPTIVTVDSAPHYTSPGLRGFQERMDGSRMGTYIDEKALRKEDGRLLGSVLAARIPTLARVITYGRANRVFLPADCAVYFNGVLMRGRIDLSDFSPEVLAAVEFYKASAAPAQFSGGSPQCGVLLLWSRER